MARKGENIYKRKDGRYEGRYIHSYDENGKAKYAYIYDKTYKGVKEKLIQAKAKLPNINSDKIKFINNIKYEDLLYQWLSKKKMSVKDSTYIRYKNIVNNHIVSSLGKYQIGQISTSLMEQFVKQKLDSGKLDNSGGISTKTMSDIMVIIKGTFKYAQSKGIPTICDFSEICIKHHTHVMRVLTDSEEKRLITVLSADIDRYKLGVFICLFTGIRIGELCALKWKNISFTDKTLKVEQTMQRLQYESDYSEQKTRIIITEPKSYAAVRIIPLPDFLINLMKPFAANPNAYILSGECKVYVEPRTMQNRFKTYLSKGKIDDANFHSLRHTFATRCIEVGFDIKTLSEILGHSNVKITLDKYVHSSLALKRNQMDKLQLMVSSM